MKVAILGVWHVHAGSYTTTAKEYGEVVGVYDEDPVRRAEFAKKFEIPEFSTLEELLASDAEGVICNAATNKHKEVLIAAANAGKHIFTEKVLALSEEDCDAIREAVERNGVRFVISFIWKMLGGYQSVKKAVDAGLIGTPNYMRFRNCHDGSTSHWLPAHFYNKEQCGGGAMIDLGAHGMYLTHWIMGEPTGYQSAFEHFCRDEQDAILNPDGIEDNALTVMTYDNGAIAINETGFVSRGCPTMLEVGGTDGYIMQEGDKYLLRTREGVSELEVLEDLPKPIISFMKGETPEGCGLDEATALTRMMVGAYAGK